MFGSYANHRGTPATDPQAPSTPEEKRDDLIERLSTALASQSELSLAVCDLEGPRQEFHRISELLRECRNHLVDTRGGIDNDN